MADILTEKLNSLKNTTPTSEKKTEQDQEPKKKGPGGVVLGKDGKPFVLSPSPKAVYLQANNKTQTNSCRTCMSAADWAAMTGKRKLNPSSSTTNNTNSTTTPPIPADCPPDVEQLGRSTWTLLHTLTANYPTQATSTEQTEMHTFLNLFSKLYPCWFCAEDFRGWMGEGGGRNQPRLEGRKEFGDWMCEAHNAVNRKLGKKEFDCKRWEERWRTGWKDGRCD